MKLWRWGSLILLVAVFFMLQSAVARATETVVAPPLINEIYTNAPGSAELGHEFVELVNNGTTPIDLSGYVLQIKASPTKIMPLSGTLETGEYKAFITTFALSNSGDTIELAQNQAGTMNILQEVLFGASTNDSQSWSYFAEGWELAPVTANAPNQHTIVIPVDVCSATPEIDTIVPDGYEINDDNECVPVIIPPVLCDNQVVLSEFLTDPVGLEANGGEFIELYNPGDQTVSLEGCHLFSNKSANDVVSFTQSDTIAPSGYFTVTLADKLINTNGAITFTTAQNEEVINYSGVTEGSAFALINHSWQLTNQPTPNAANQTSVVAVQPSTQNEEQETAQYAPCPVGKYRSTETNRCRNTEIQTASVTPCADNQVRNPETNRCRKILLAAATLTPCNADQERNPQTNRCRKITSTSADLAPCSEGQVRNPETNRCRKVTTATTGSVAPASIDPKKAKTPFLFDNRIIVAIVVVTIGYGIYEYRTDIMVGLKKIVGRRSNGAPPG